MHTHRHTHTHAEQTENGLLLLLFNVNVTILNVNTIQPVSSSKQGVRLSLMLETWPLIWTLIWSWRQSPWRKRTVPFSGYWLQAWVQQNTSSPNPRWIWSDTCKLTISVMRIGWKCKFSGPPLLGTTDLMTGKDYCVCACPRRPLFCPTVKLLWQPL